MRRVAELIRGRLVDRDSARTGGRVGLLAGMDLTGIKTPVVAHGHSSSIDRHSPVGQERDSRGLIPTNQLNN